MPAQNIATKKESELSLRLIGAFILLSVGVLLTFEGSELWLNMTISFVDLLSSETKDPFQALNTIYWAATVCGLLVGAELFRATLKPRDFFRQAFLYVNFLAALGISVSSAKLLSVIPTQSVPVWVFVACGVLLMALGAASIIFFSGIPALDDDSE